MGGEYSYMVILNTDSVVSGTCLTDLVRLMDANPNAGIIQSAPKAVGMDTLYARIQQLAARVYGLLFTASCIFGNWASRTTGAITPSSACSRLSNTVR